MSSRRTPVHLCWIIPASLTLGGIILYTAALSTAFDQQVGYFTAGPLPTWCAVLYLLAVLLPVVLAVLLPKGRQPLVLTGQASRYPALFLGLGDLLYAVVTVAPWIAGQEKPSPALLFRLLLAVLLAAYSFLVLTRVGRLPDGLAALGCLSLLLPALLLYDSYRDFLVAVNSPIKLAFQFGFIGAMLATLAELRFRFGKAQPRTALVFFGVGAFLTLVPTVAYLLSAVGQGLDYPSYTAYAVLLIGYGLFSLSRLILYVFQPSDRTPPAAACETDPAQGGDA